MRPMLVLAAGVLIGLTAGAHAATTDLEFAITRDGDAIGTYQVRIVQTGSDVTVNTSTSLEVKKLLVTLYRREQRSTERHLNGRVVAFRSTTDDNGTKYQVDAAVKGTVLELTANGRPTQVDKNLLPLSLWNAAVVRQSTGFDDMNGKVVPITVTDRGIEEINAPDRPIQAHRYTIEGVFKQEVWYSEQGHLVRVRFDVTRAGMTSTITYELTSLRLDPASPVTASQPPKPR
jgi:hypothetical protein